MLGLRAGFGLGPGVLKHRRHRPPPPPPDGAQRPAHNVLSLEEQVQATSIKITTKRGKHESWSAGELRDALEQADRRLCRDGLPLYCAAEGIISSPATVALHVLGQSADKLAGMLAAKRYFLPTESGDKSGGEALSFDPRFLAFEHAGRFMLRKAQVELVRDLYKQAMVSKSTCQQMLMGGGKTTVIGPMLALLLGAAKPRDDKQAEGRLVVQVVPDALLDMSRNVMRAAFGLLLPKSVYSFAFERESQGDRIKLLKGIHRRFASARDAGAVVCTTPGAIKSLMLSFIDRLATEESVSSLMLVPLDRLPERVRTRAKLVGKRLDERAVEAIACADIIKIFRGSIALIDEVDLVLHPLRSELNYPIGELVPLDLNPGTIEEPVWELGVDVTKETEQSKLAGTNGKKELQPGTERWTLPLHLIDALFHADGQPMAKQTKERFGEKASELLTSGHKKCLQEVIRRGVEAYSISRVPHLVLLDKAFYDANMAPTFARWALLWYNDQPCVAKVQVSETDLQTGLVRWLHLPRPPSTPQPPLVAPNSPAADADTDVIEADAVATAYLTLVNGTRAMALLNLCRKWVRALLPHVISKRNRVDYGLLSDDDTIRLGLLSEEEEKQRSTEPKPPKTRKELLEIKRASRELLAVPFVGKDTPSRFSEFAQPEVIIGFTIAAYRIEGLRERDITRFFSRLLNQFSRASEPVPKRPQRKALEEWKRLAAESWMALEKGEKEALGVPPTVPPLELLQLTDKKHIKALSTLLRRLPTVVVEYCKLEAFRLTQHDTKGGGGYALEKLSASGMDLGSDSLFKSCVGFSGTPSDMIPRKMYISEIEGCKPEKGTDRKVANLTMPMLHSPRRWISILLFYHICYAYHEA